MQFDIGLHSVKFIPDMTIHQNRETGPPEGDAPISSNIILLDLVERYKGATEILNRYNTQAGECILCYNLFEPLKAVIKKYGLNGRELLADLTALTRKP